MKGFGIVGGTGFYKLLDGKEARVATPYGRVSMTIGDFNGVKVAFMARHGSGHTAPPHAVNYKANIFALNKLGYRNILSTSAVGIIDRYRPGDLILLRDFVGFHMGPITYFDRFDSEIRHVDMSEPYSKELNGILSEAARIEKIKLKDGGVIMTTFGPRLETKSEIKAFGKMGANLVGMTNAYEVILANELGMNYATVAVGTNYAAGVGKSKLTIEEVYEMMKKKSSDIKRLLGRAIRISSL